MLQEYGLDQFGDFARADLESPPYDCTHVLSTDHEPRQGDNSFHNSLASDSHVPVDDDGIPLLAEDYTYLMVQ